MAKDPGAGSRDNDSEAELKVREAFSREDHDRMIEEFIQKVRSVN